MMKKYSLLICVSLISFGCSDFLDQENPNTLTPGNFWQTEADANSAIIGAYSPLSTVFYNGRIWMGHELSRSDEYFYTGGFAGGTALFNTSPTDGNFTAAFSEMWKVIFRANLVLQNVPDIEMNADLKNSILGEAYFLRGYQYFVLVNHWGSVPLVTEPAATLAETQQGPSSVDAIWQQIKEDLTNAISLLPTSWDDTNKGRVTKATASAMLGKSHLYLEEWALAATEFGRIIGGDYGTYDLMPNYSDNFRESTENNIESLFEIQFDNVGAWTAGWGADVPNTARFSSHDADFSRFQASIVNDWVYDLYLSESTNSGDIDPRTFESIMWDYEDAMHFGQPFADRFSGQLETYNANPENVRRPVRTAKYIDPNNTASFPLFNTNGNNRRMIRFADVLLMHAEAENEASGPSTSAYASINRVRARVDMPEIPAGLSQEEFRQKVRDERTLELFSESHRALDLLRWGILPETFQNNPDYRAAAIQYVPGRELLPIPQIELDTNPNWNDQNDGYLL